MMGDTEIQHRKVHQKIEIRTVTGNKRSTIQLLRLRRTSREMDPETGIHNKGTKGRHCETQRKVKGGVQRGRK